MRRNEIRKKAHHLVNEFGTNDPFRLCSALEIPVYYDDLGKNIMGFNAKFKRISTIVINYKFDEMNQKYAAGHELGHDTCGHKDNTDFLKKNSLMTRKIGVEYEANCFMTDLILDGSEVDDFRTEQEFINFYGVPNWAKNCVDWEYLLSQVKRWY